MENKAYYFYVLYCADNTFYGGYSDDVLKRFETHEAGKGAKYTRVKSRHPLHLIYSQRFDSKSEAMKAEYQFKHQSRLAKEHFLNDHQINWQKYQ
ncbi:GIY-YIG nuclease family protein [Paucilactobacillus nenjiangensis]|uniref:GIY-YIG nuclease family protein n=1 Tax=Paucilactobacillus nenjiangensis TaxID=1296540 RepID=UPI0010F45B92|nr:GIY-YIG nuclease family protein [Paucilactobacillus nenjiangensis]